MHIKLNEREQKLLDLLIMIPPNIDGAECYLRTEDLDRNEVTKVAIEYVYECFCEVDDYECTNNIPRPKDIVQNLHSTYIIDVIALLLQHGLDPNGIYEDCNIMESLHYVDNEFLAADALALLLEHGGNYNLVVDGEELFRSTDFDVFFDTIEQYERQKYASLVHYWMVMIGYGARCGEDKMQAFREYNSSETFDWDKLKNHRNYYLGRVSKPSNHCFPALSRPFLWGIFAQTCSCALSFPPHFFLLWVGTWVKKRCAKPTFQTQENVINYCKQHELWRCRHERTGI